MSTTAPPLPAQRAVQISVAILAAAAAVAMLYFGRVFIITMVIAAIIAFLLDPVVTIFVRLRLPRAVASFIVCSIALLILYLLGLGVYTQVSSFMGDLPAYSQRMNDVVDNVATRVDQIEK
jgi:predicted PurR-regulated permease PerM